MDAEACTNFFWQAVRADVKPGMTETEVETLLDGYAAEVADLDPPDDIDRNYMRSWINERIAKLEE